MPQLQSLNRPVGGGGCYCCWWWWWRSLVVPLSQRHSTRVVLLEDEGYMIARTAVPAACQGPSEAYGTAYWQPAMPLCVHWYTRDTRWEHHV